MQELSPRKIVWLSNIYDQNYEAERGEEIVPCLSSAKRRDLIKCVADATGLEVVILSSPPKAARRRGGKWLPALKTKFSSHTQFFCPNWDIPKLRIPLSWFFYVRHALKHTRRGDLVIIDNYEIIYVFAAYGLKWFRGVHFVLDYEDGKHLIDKSWSRVLSGLAELMGRRLVQAAFLTHPSLAARLPARVPTELVPGFVVGTNSGGNQPNSDSVRFLYSGSLDAARGIDVLLGALPLLPVAGWRLDITGAGPLEADVARAAQDRRWSDRLTYHGVLPSAVMAELVAQCDVGLNCQKTSDPISEVTFPSKIFSYLSAGLLIVSSRASQVDKVCGNACLYYEADDPRVLAAAIRQVVENFSGLRNGLDEKTVREKYSLEGTAERLKKILIPITAQARAAC